MMKATTKTKTVSKPKKASDAAKTVKQKKVATTKYIPGEDEIREKAREIYYERMARGEHGTPEGDWHEAEDLLKGS
jgi:hypothetical protein